MVDEVECSRRLAVLAILAVGLLVLPDTVRAADGETGDASARAEAETADMDEPPGASKPWRLYHRAFVALTDADREMSVSMLLRVRNQYPDHAAALFARRILRIYRRRGMTVDSGALRDADLEPDDGNAEGGQPRHPATLDRKSGAYDPYWIRYRKAFVALARGGVAKSRSHLRKIEGDSHSAGPLAGEVLSNLTDSESDDTSGVAPPTDPVESEASRAAGRVAGEVGLGLLFGAAGGVVGGALGVGIQGLLGIFSGVPVVAGGLVGLVGALPVGVGIAGGLTESGSKLTGAYLGGAIGGLLSAGAFATGSVFGLGVPVVGLVPPLIGSIIGFEVAHGNQPGVSERQPVDPLFQPTVGYSQRHSIPTLGFRGRF